MADRNRHRGFRRTDEQPAEVRRHDHPKSFKWNALALEEDVVAAVETLKRQRGRNLFTYGSATFAQTLLRYDLVDELRLMVYSARAWCY